MNNTDKANQTTDDTEVLALVTRQDLDHYWIGIGGAIDWIAMRGQPMSVQSYRLAENEAAEALVAALGDMAPKIAKSLVHGERKSKSGVLRPIPPGIWPQTATSEANYGGKRFRLIGADDQSDFGGSIFGKRKLKYKSIQIRTDFIRARWPEHTREINPTQKKAVVARAEIKRQVEKIFAFCPENSPTPTQRETFELVRRTIPSASRDVVREFHKELFPSANTGPRGPRIKDRQKFIDELGGKLIAAQLPN